jgi:mono/diheme cytochrome c family protein
MTARPRSGRLALALALACACRAPAPARPVELIASALPAAGEVIAAVELAGALYLVAPDRITIARGGASAVSVPPPEGAWAEAVATPALDRAGPADAAARWVVARTTGGGLWRITATGEVEPVDDRLGLPPRARALGADGDTLAIAFDDALAVLRDRAHVTRYPLAPAPGPARLAVGRDRIALVRGGQLAVWDLAAQARVAYPVPDALAAGFAGGALVVATPAALWREDAGQLRRLAPPAALRGLAIAGSRVWITTARGAFVLDGDRFVPAAAAAAAAVHLVGLPGGDLVAAGTPQIARLSLGGGDDPRWRAEIKPIIDRVCLRCHGPGGSAGLDLSTLTAWRADRGELVRRVVETRTMPPAGTALTDADRRTLARWLGP